MKYIVASVVCAIEMLVISVMCEALGWKRGGNAVTMAIWVVVAMGTWKRITRERKPDGAAQPDDKHPCTTGGPKSTDGFPAVAKTTIPTGSSSAARNDATLAASVQSPARVVSCEKPEEEPVLAILACGASTDPRVVPVTNATQDSTTKLRPSAVVVMGTTFLLLTLAMVVTVMFWRERTSNRPVQSSAADTRAVSVEEQNKSLSENEVAFDLKFSQATASIFATAENFQQKELDVVLIMRDLPPDEQFPEGMETDQLTQVDDLITSKKYREALELLTNLRDSHAQNPSYWSAVWRVQSKLGNHDLAVQSCKTAIETLGQSTFSRQTAKLHFLMGVTLFRLEKTDEAIVALHAAIAKDPGPRLGYEILAGAYRQLGYAHIGKGEFSKAIEAYQNAVQTKPDSVAAYVALGGGYSMQAVSLDNIALQFTAPEAWAMKANLQADAKQARHSGLSAYRTAIALDPKSLEANFGAAKVLSALGQHVEAVETGEKTLALRREVEEGSEASGSNDGSTDFKLMHYRIDVADIYSCAGRYDDAESTLRQVLKETSDPFMTTQAYIGLANVYKDKKDFAEVISVCTLILDVAPRISDDNAGLREYFVRNAKGRLEEAKKKLRKED